MLTYDEIVEYIKDNGLRNLMTPYQGNNGVGVMYSVEIEDYGKTEPRLAIFDGIAELARFADQMKISDKVTTNEHGLIVSEPRFMLRGKILTTQSLSIEKKRKRTLEATKKEYYEYKRRRLSVISKKIEIIKKEIEELEKTIKHFSKKGALLFKGTLSDKNDKNVTSLFEFDITDLPTDSGSLQDFVRLKITYNSLRKRKEHLQKKLDILSEYSQKGFMKKLVSSQKEILDLLSTVDTQSDLNFDFRESDLLKYEDLIKRTLLKYESRPVIPELHLFLLNYLKNLDSLPLEFLSEAYVMQESINLDATINNAGKEETRYKLEQSAPTQDEKNTQLLISLKEQYDINLTEDQKDALIIYNSQLFCLLNEISNIENFEATDNAEIQKQIEQSPNFPTILKSIVSQCHRIQKDSMRKDSEYYEKFKSMLNQIFPNEIISDFLRSIDYSKKTVKEPETFNPLMYDLIGRLKNVIKIIQDIPQDAIVLPEDITVYRGVDSKYLRTPQIIAKGSFISTSLQPQKALHFGGDQPTLYKIHLKKGTPVKILPIKVRSEMEYERFLLEANPADPNGTKEILLISQDMQDFEITESISPIIHYQFENREFIENKRGFIITGEMEPKIVQQARQEIDAEEKII